MLIVARVFQGLGASMMTPQTMAVITRIFPADRRGQAMALWGATAGVATLVGPILGGVLVDALGWEWIFFINIPVGIVGFVLAVRLVPTLPTHTHQLRLARRRAQRRRHVPAGLRHPGGPPVRLGHDHRIDHGLALIIGGLVRASRLFVVWQAHNRSEPLVPLSLFRDRNFSIWPTSRSRRWRSRSPRWRFPIMLYAQLVRGLLADPVGAAARADGGDVDRAGADRRASSPTRSTRALITGFGFAASIVVAGLPDLADDDARRARSGRSCCRWRCSASAMAVHLGTARARPPPATCRCSWPGPGPGVYNATRQVGAVLGSAAIAVLMDSPHRRPRALRRCRARGRACSSCRAGRARPVQRRRCPTRCCCRPPSWSSGFVVGAVLPAPPPPDARTRPQPATAGSGAGARLSLAATSYGRAADGSGA